MAYYPIKCPYCLKTHTNDTVLFNLTGSTITSSRISRKKTDSAQEPVLDVEDSFVEGGSNWDSEDASTTSFFTTGHSKAKKLPTDGYYTFAELREIFGPDSVKPAFKTVNALPALTSSEYDGELLYGVTITLNEDDKEIEKSIYTRHCDCERKLNTSAGSVPCYVVLMMGSSRAGKTMYIISLYNAIMREGGFSLPPTPDANDSIARLSLSVISDGAEDTAIETMADNLFEYGKLPSTTYQMTNEPLIMDITLRFTKSGLIKKALLFIRDMPGENLTNREKHHEIVSITRQFPRFDGFMMMFDPFTFRETIFPTPDKEKDKEQRRQVERLRAVIVEHIAPIMKGNIITQPTAVIITKGDMFFNRDYSRSLINKGVLFSNPLLAAGQNETFDKPYFSEVDTGARDIIGKLSSNITELVNAHFNDAFYSMTSALSREPIEIDEKAEKVLTPTAISSWRVTDPALRLLMKLCIIPPFDETVMRRKTGERTDEQKARKFRNRAIINEWGEKYCSGWENI